MKGKQQKGTGGMEKKGRRMLDVLADERMRTALETALEKNAEYQEALKQQEEAVGQMEKEKSGGEWEKTADRAVSAVNHCGAVYGAAACRQGLQDGIRVAWKLSKLPDTLEDRENQ